MAPTRRRGSGKFPEFGAIFMSNTETRRECFSRSLFALPRTSAEFVRKVKKGMILFLFDHQHKKLFGVFEAVSDGGLNIVPHAYASSRKSFPAQVRFRIIWKCSPLYQHEFRDAIRDNYYEEHKFNFGLSKDQVWKLLYLFKSRVRIQRSPTERKIKHSDHSCEKKSVDFSSCEPHELGEFVPSFESRVKMQKSPMGRKLKHNYSCEKNSVENPSYEPVELGEFIPSFESRVRIQKSKTESKIKDSDHSSETQSVDISSCEPLELGEFIPLFESRVRIQKSPREGKIEHSDPSTEKKCVDISSCEPLEPGEFISSFESGVRIQKSLTERKIKHSDHSSEKRSVNISLSEPLEPGEFIPSFDSRVRIRKSPTERKVKWSDHSCEKKSVDTSSCEPLELGEFIPLFLPGSFGSSSSQSSPGRSKDQDIPERHPKVKSLYSDHIEERKSVFARLESEKYSMDKTKDTTGDLDINANVYHCKDLKIERKRSYADVKTIKEIMENLLQRQKSWMKNQTGRSHGRRKRETPRVANKFFRSKFNSESNKQEKETSKENEKTRARAGCDKYFGRGRYEKYFGRDKHYGRAEKNNLAIPVKKRDHGVCLSDMQQKKRKLAMQIPSTEIENDGVCESHLDDQAQSCENSIVSIESESLQVSPPSNVPSKVDAMLENIRDQNQGQEKCEEKNVLLSWESEMIDIFYHYKRFLDDMVKVVFSLGADDDNNDAKFRTVEDKLESLSNMNSAETPIRCVPSLKKTPNA